MFAEEGVVTVEGCGGISYEHWYRRRIIDKRRGGGG